MSEQLYNAGDYEQRYASRQYMPAYPDGQIVRVHRHVLQWELGMNGGQMLDFGCGAGHNAKYFADHGFVPFGCDTSEAAIAHSKAIMPEHAGNFVVIPPTPVQLSDHVRVPPLDLTISNQVLYYLDDSSIRQWVHQLHELTRPGGVFIATMMAPSCWYARHAKGTQGDFTRVVLDTARVKQTTFINFKNAEELERLFAPFVKLHTTLFNPGYFHDDEGPTDHWIYVGQRAQ